jgi:hypothetical protein
MPHEEQELVSLPDHLSSSTVISGVRVARSLLFYVVFCRSLLALQPVMTTEIVVEHFPITAIFEEKLSSLFVIRKYRVVFLLCFSSSCLPYVAILSFIS